MKRMLLIAGLVVVMLGPAARAVAPAPAPGPWSAHPAVGNAMGHTLGFMMRVSRTHHIVEVNLDYEGDVVQCTFRNVSSGNWLVAGHLRNISRPIDGRTRSFSVSMRDTALNDGGLPGATVRFALRITGRFTGRHAASGTIRFTEGCTIPARYAPWRAIG